MTNIETTIKQNIGALCEVHRLDNHLMFASTVQAYDDENKDLTIVIRKGSETPQGIVYRTPVKLRVHTDRQLQSVLLLYGLVVRCSVDFWKITLMHSFSCLERRGNFRQTVFAEAVVTRGTDEQGNSSSPCRMIDVSLSGLCFRSRETYFPGEQLVVSALQLRQDGPIYTFGCTVERIQPLDNARSGEMRYGCRYNNITEAEQDQLFHDLFSLQIKALNRL